MIKALTQLVMLLLFFVAGCGIGMAFDPDWEYCRPQPLSPSAGEDCHYEQSTEAPGLEVCK